MIEVPEVIYDRRARDGTWCRLPYPGHPKGCPNFPRCPDKYENFKEVEKNYVWYAVVEEFNLKDHAKRMKRIHLAWTERQCRNLLYWQGALRVRLERKVIEAKFELRGQVFILYVPEACGINVFETMAKVGVVIDRHPDVVRKIMMIGRRDLNAT